MNGSREKIYICLFAETVLPKHTFWFYVEVPTAGSDGCVQDTPVLRVLPKILLNKSLLETAVHKLIRADRYSNHIRASALISQI